MDSFDAVVYINLAHRRDRKREILQELDKMGVSQKKIHRVDAVHDILNGHRGCAQSHYQALELADKSGWSNVLILEDDMMFTSDKVEVEQQVASFFKHFQNNWDVFFLGANVFESTPTLYQDVRRVVCAQCAHAYAVNRHYFKELQECFHAAYLAMQEDEMFVDSLFKAIDQKWKELQPSGKWYIGKVLGQQRRSYSDIEHLIRNRHHEAL